MEIEAFYSQSPGLVIFLTTHGLNRFYEELFWDDIRVGRPEMLDVLGMKVLLKQVLMRLPRSTNAVMSLPLVPQYLEEILNSI